jgi:hypothetical protein
MQTLTHPAGRLSSGKVSAKLAQVPVSNALTKGPEEPIRDAAEVLVDGWQDRDLAQRVVTQTVMSVKHTLSKQAGVGSEAHFGKQLTRSFRVACTTALTESIATPVKKELRRDVPTEPRERVAWAVARRTRSRVGDPGVVLASKAQLARLRQDALDAAAGCCFLDDPGPAWADEVTDRRVYEALAPRLPDNPALHRALSVCARRAVTEGPLDELTEAGERRRELCTRAWRHFVADWLVHQEAIKRYAREAATLAEERDLASIRPEVIRAATTEATKLLLVSAIAFEWADLKDAFAREITNATRRLEREADALRLTDVPELTGDDGGLGDMFTDPVANPDRVRDAAGEAFVLIAKRELTQELMRSHQRSGAAEDLATDELVAIVADVCAGLALSDDAADRQAARRAQKILARAARTGAVVEPELPDSDAAARRTDVAWFALHSAAAAALETLSDAELITLTSEQGGAGPRHTLDKRCRALMFADGLVRAKLIEEEDLAERGAAMLVSIELRVPDRPGPEVALHTELSDPASARTYQKLLVKAGSAWPPPTATPDQLTAAGQMLESITGLRRELLDTAFAKGHHLLYEPSAGRAQPDNHAAALREWLDTGRVIHCAFGATNLRPEALLASDQAATGDRAEDATRYVTRQGLPGQWWYLHSKEDDGRV